MIEIREHYENNYPFTMESIEFQKANFRDRLRWLEIAFELNGCNGLLLDVGCGGGAVLRFFKGRSIGVDISSKLLRLVNRTFKKEGLENVGFIVADAQHLPFKNSAFDLIVCSETLEHLPQPEMAVREIARTVRLKALITVPNMFAFEAIQASGLKVHNLYNRLFKYLHRNRKSPLDRFYFEHLTRKTIPQWKNLLLTNGLLSRVFRGICLGPYIRLLDGKKKSAPSNSRFAMCFSFRVDRFLGSIFPFNFLGQYTLFECKKANRNKAKN